MAVTQVLLTEKINAVITAAEKDQHTPKELKKRIKNFREQEPKRDDKNVVDYSLVRDVTKHLRSNSANGQFYLHEILANSEIVEESYKEEPKSPELEARLRQLRMQMEAREYAAMVENVDGLRSERNRQVRSLDIQDAKKQMSFVVNLLVTMVSLYVFGYYAAYYAFDEVASRVLVGIVFAVAAVAAEMYFIIRENLTTIPKTDPALAGARHK
eukprot:Colp12_sorted_trinity150504_noHs@7895